MIIDKDEILSVLAATKAALSKKDIMAQAQHFIFTGKDVAAYNDQICIVHPFETDFVCSVKGEEFYKILSGITEEKVEIALEKDSLKISTKTTKASLSTSIADQEKVEDLIEMLKVKCSKENFWKVLPKSFKEGIFLCMFAATRDLTRGVLTCVAIRGKDVVATDDNRISWYRMKKSMDNILIPAKNVEELVNYDVVEYGASKGWTHFRTKDNIVFHSRNIPGEYDYDFWLEQFDHECEMFELPAELKGILENINILASGGMDINKWVTLIIDDGTITCKAQQELGKVTKVLPVEYNGEPLMFNVTPTFFAQILAKTTNFGLFPENSAIFINESFKHLVCLPAPPEVVEKSKKPKKSKK